MVIASQLFWALLGSKWVRRLGICTIAVAAYAWWDATTQNKGAEKVIVKIEKKANANAEIANEVRAADGKGGRADPYLRRP